MKSSYIDHIKPGVLKWLESVRFKDQGWGRWKYNTHMCRPYGLQCSGLAIRILDWAGELDNRSPEEKRQAVDFFLSCQDPNDGYFKDTLVDDTQWGEHRISWQEVWHQMSSA